MTEEQATMAPKKKKKILFVLLALLLFLAAIAVVIWRSDAEPEAPKYEPNVTVGSMPGKSLEAIEAELQGKVDERSVSYTVNGKPYFEDGGAMGSLKLDCPANNVNNLQFVISIDETEEQIYDSGVLEPGSYIEEDRLQREETLPAGVYPCTVVITATSADGSIVRGTTNASITLTVEN